MGLCLVSYKENKDVFWSRSYSTFFRLRRLHEECMTEAYSKDKGLRKRLEELIYPSSFLTIDETEESFYKHSDCEGSWCEDEIKALRVFLRETREHYVKFVENDEDDVGVLDNLIEVLEDSDHIEFC